MDKPANRLPSAWPSASDQAAAARLVERFAGLGEAERQFAAQPEAAAMLACFGGHSPYLSDLAVRESAALLDIGARGPDAVVQQALTELGGAAITSARPRIAAALRQAKRIVALAVAVADIGGIWNLERVMGTLSAAAETALRLSVAHLLRAAHDGGDIRLPNPGNPAQGSGFTVLGMGKLGARELNYSSDVDLVLLYDPAAGVYIDPEA
ncbi:MAG: hypothetical protein JOZ17_15330, partial [Acetobacteraceae bacterium]|nr:hypothetical protein [Acetobacteraceae bacterium]